MQSLFGIPINTLLMILVALFALAAVALTISIWRNRVMFRLGARNLPRRPAHTVLTCLGLMLASMIFSASFATGDTLTYSIRSLSIDSLGQVDVMVMGEGTEFGAVQERIEGAGVTDYFDPIALETVEEALSPLIAEGKVDGVVPAIIETVPAVALDTRLNEPAVTVLGLDRPDSGPFDPLLDRQGNELSLEKLKALGPGFVYVSEKLAQKLDKGPSESFNAHIGAGNVPLTVAGVYRSGGNPTMYSTESGGSIVMPLAHLQAYLATEKINFILITHRGDKIEGARHTDAVIAAVEEPLGDTGLKAEPVKRDALDAADETGSMFSTLFVVFGSFSIIAGILLIFLIFVMLAAERKHELGIARAVGTQRGHVIRMFTYEGVLYALGASAIGSALGLLVSWGMIQIMAAAFEEMGFAISYHFTIKGLVIAYTMGVVLTVIVVGISAWRVSNLNIISAIKDIPEPKQEVQESLGALFRKAFRRVHPFGRLTLLWIDPRPAMRLWMALSPWALPVIGTVMMLSGIEQRAWTPYSVGASLVIIGLCLLARKFFLPERAAYTLAGVGILIFWLSPTEWHPHGEEMAAGFDMFVLSGVMLVMGAVWIVMYNSDLLLSGIMALFGRLKALTPMIKTAVAYPMASRFRTGMALAMFALIVFTLVWMSSMNASIDAVLDDTDRVSGGFQIRAEVMNRTNTIPDLRAALEGAEGVSADDFESIAGFYLAPVGIRDIVEPPAAGDAATESPPAEPEWADFYLMGADAAYADSVPYDLQIMAEGYGSKEEVWRALKENPSVAVVSSEMVPTKYGQMGGGGQVDVRIGEGQFYVEDKVIPPDVYFEVRNPYTGATQKLHLIAVVDVMAGPYAYLVTVSKDTLGALGYFDDPLSPFRDPISYRLKVRPEKLDQVPVLAENLEKAFLEHGLNANVMAQEVKDFTKIYDMFWNISIAFMGLGLVVGIAALGVIAARSVVERRQQIGMLRAIGFRQGMVQFSFLLESSFVGLLGIGLGLGLGVGTSLLFTDEAQVQGIRPVIPWVQLGLIVALAYGAALLTTFIPAYRAARIYPAEALRYE